MKKQLTILLLLVVMISGSSWSQKKVVVKDAVSKNDMQSELNKAIIEIVKEIADLEKQLKTETDEETIKDLKEQIEMLKKQLQMMQGLNKNVFKMSDKIVQYVAEDDGSATIPQKDISRISILPKRILTEAELNSLVFGIQNIGQWHYLISNLCLAVGAPETRKKILEQNKWVTHGILFDVNSATIKPESYGTLKEMANVLKEYTDLKVKFVGHTDADGKDDANLDLSKHSAASVKVALAKEFGIYESRMETDGKGESEPIEKNDTPAGKVNNRRVEFIKI